MRRTLTRCWLSGCGTVGVDGPRSESTVECGSRSARTGHGSMTVTMMPHLCLVESAYHALCTCDLTRMKTPSRIFTTPV